MQFISRGLVAGVSAMLFVAFPASAQDSSIFVQCPTSTTLHEDAHPDSTDDNVREEHLVAGDGIATMADGYPWGTRPRLSTKCGRRTSRI